MLNGDALRSAIDDPIDAVVDQFAGAQSGKTAHARFLDVITRFVHLVYEQGLPFRRRLTREQAAAEALYLLTMAYGRQDAVAAARADAEDAGGGGISNVLAALAEAIKAQLRRDYESSAFATTVLACDWATRVRIAELILSEPHVRTALGNPPPEQYADELPHLIRLRMDEAALLAQLLNAPSSIDNR